MSAPVRTCVGCGARDAQGVLLRFTAAAEALRIDGARRRPGRGAYLHRDSACWVAFSRRRGAVRSLRASVPAAERARFVASLGEAGEGAR